MEKRKLGNSQLEVSKICLGTMSWGEQNTQKEAHEQLDYALANGVNFIDTAEVYPVPPNKDTTSLTEQYIGNWLNKNKRSDIVLATKMAGVNVGWIRGGRGFVVTDIEQAIDHSLARLQTDVIDLYQLHWPQREVPLWGKQNYHESMFDEHSKDNIAQFYQALQAIKTKGKVREFGLSNETAWGVMAYKDIAKQYNLSDMISIQNAYSLVRREYEVGLAEVSLAENIGLLAYSPLAGGLLSGKYENNAMPKGSRFDLFPEMMGYYKNNRTIAALKEYKKLANELSISLTQLSLAFVNDRKFVSSNIIGATSIVQLAENIGSAEILLSDEAYKKIDEIWTEYPNPGNF